MINVEDLKDYGKVKKCGTDENLFHYHLSKQKLRNIKSNIDRFLKMRVTPKIYFKYLYDKPPIESEFDFSFVKLPKVNRKFV